MLLSFPKFTWADVLDCPWVTVSVPRVPDFTPLKCLLNFPSCSMSNHGGARLQLAMDFCFCCFNLSQSKFRRLCYTEFHVENTPRNSSFYTVSWYRHRCWEWDTRRLFLLAPLSACCCRWCIPHVTRALRESQDAISWRASPWADLILGKPLALL